VVTVVQGLETVIKDLNIFELLSLENRISRILRKEARNKEHRKLLKLQSEIIAKLTDYAIKDPLTGLLNRTAYGALMQGLTDNWTNRNQDFAHLIIDVDHFKRINDEYGHKKGDSILTYLAETIKNNLKYPTYRKSYALILKQENPVRIGGEEIVLLFPESSERNARNKGELLRRKIFKAFCEQKDLPDVTVSGGVASAKNSSMVATLQNKICSSSEICEAMYLLSDFALYQAKAMGRNKVLSFQEAMQTPLTSQAREKLEDVLPGVMLYKQKIMS
jgi:diguanylate cyclase (GGDEF)-like protein